MKHGRKAGKETDYIPSISAPELAEKVNKGPVHILDIRKTSEYQSEHLPDAENAPLDYLNDSMVKADKSKTWYVHCATGYRSVIFISILKARGFNNLVNVRGGIKALKGVRKIPGYRLCETDNHVVAGSK